MNTKKLFLFLLLSFTTLVINAQQKWFSKFGWWGVDIGYDVVETLDGHFMVTGYTGTYTFGNSDVLVAKVNKNGWLMWAQHIGGSNNDIGKAIVRTADSGFVIAGYTNTFGSGGYDGYLIKVNKTGNLIWQRTYGGIDWDFFNSVQQTKDTGFVMVGYSYSNSKGSKDIWIVKTDSLGNIQWEKRIGGTNDDEAVSVEILHDGRIACFGTTYSFSDTKGNYFIYKTNNNGDSLFFKDFGYNNLEDVGYDFFERPSDSAFVICGSSQSPFGSDTLYYHRLLVDSLCNWILDVKNTDGNLKNQRVMSGIYFRNTEYVVVSDHFGLGKGKHEPGFFLFSNQWGITAVTYGSPEDDYIFSIKRTADKGLVGVGYTLGFNALQEDVFIVKLDSTLQFANNVVSVNEIENKISFRVFPNPASDYLYLESDTKLNDGELNIFDLQGRLVFYQKIENNIEKFDISSLQNGMYILNAIVDGQKFTGKLVVNKQN
jgi:hypothetical protein